ncbi:band 7 protein AGAP004871 [Homalodisca vitripennis]|nr:band 7 protein AGAP004871 [Homalodisca vitripennis]
MVTILTYHLLEASSHQDYCTRTITDPNRPSVAVAQTLRTEGYVTPLPLLPGSFSSTRDSPVVTDDEGPGDSDICGTILTLFLRVFVVCTLPLSHVLVLPPMMGSQETRDLRNHPDPVPSGLCCLHSPSLTCSCVIADNGEPEYSADDGEPGDSGICGTILTALSWVVVVCTLPFSLFVCFKVVQEYERAVIFRLGRLVSGGAKGPGIFFILPCIDNYARVDLRTRTYDVPPQEVLTKDSVTVSVDAVVYYRVSNATISVANVANAHHSTRLLAQTTLRNVLGTRPLHEILSDREAISNTMQTSLDDATEAWGIKVERVEIKDVRLPVQLQRAMAAEAEAAREARAKVIAAEGEQKASRALREASEVIGDSPAALQLRYLQTLNTISAEKNSTIVFPLPIDLLTYFVRAKEHREHAS